MQKLSNGRVRRTPEEWQALVKRFSASGLSQREFCRRETLNVESFNRWYRRLMTPESFVEVTPSKESPSSSTSRWTMEVELESGTIVRIRG